MASNQQYRLYSFTANLYLSPLQLGLQTAHVVSEISRRSHSYGQYSKNVYADWADQDKTIIICGAMNHRGVKDCWAEIERINGALGLPAAIFHEDEDSMNGMATACGVIVPQRLYDAKFIQSEVVEVDGEFVRTDPYWVYYDANLVPTKYPMTHAEGQFISHIKQYRLA